MLYTEIAKYYRNWKAVYDFFITIAQKHFETFMPFGYYEDTKDNIISPLSVSRNITCETICWH